MTETPWWHNDDETGPPGGADALGSAAAEATRLFEVLRERMMTDPNTLRAGMRMMEAFTVLKGSSGSQSAPPGEAPECAYCPVCQAISHARNLDPQTVERLTGAAMEFAETIRRTVAQDPATDTDDSVRHVPLDDVFDDDAAPTEAATDEADDFAGWPEPIDLDPDDESDDSQ